MMLDSFYNPYVPLSYYSPSSYDHGSSGYQDLESLQLQRQRAEALAAKRARRAQYIPAEDIDSEQDYLFGPLGPHERAHFDSRRRQETIENERRRRETEAQRYQQQLEELRRQEAARLRQAAELERNRREQAQRSQQRFGRGPTAADHHTPSYKRSFSQASQEQPRHAGQGSSPENVTAQKMPKATPRDPSPSPLATKYTQVHHDAAQRIQQLYRQQRSLRSANNIASQFEAARSGFSLPEAIDFVDLTMTSTSSGDESIVTVNTALPPSKASSSAPSKPDDDWDVVKASDDENESLGAVLSQAETMCDDQVTEGGSPDSASSGATTLSEDDEIDFKVPDEEPWVTIDPQQLETFSGSVTDGQVDTDTEDDESLSAAPSTQIAETVVGNQAEIVADDLGLKGNTARLAYTKHNYPIHAYMEKLNVLLMKLDGVESHGSQEVRERRKQVARDIEMEAERIEKLVKDIWRTYTQKSGNRE